MPLDLSALAGQPRLLIEADLAPLQGSRFQPTGFPDLGAATYKAPQAEGGAARDMLLVESAQSVANRLEAVCWDEAADDWQPPLRGLPLVKVVDKQGEALTNSLLGAHRLNSAYILDSTTQDGIPVINFFDTLFKNAGIRLEEGRININDFASTIFTIDANCLLHGVFMAIKKKKEWSRLRLARSLSGFIEAEDYQLASSGGVKNDDVRPSKDNAGNEGGSRTAVEGYGNVIFARDEYSARRIVAYFNLDLTQIRSYRIGMMSEHLLIALALYKIRRFLDTGLRLRTACDLGLTGEPRVTRPMDWLLPSLVDVETALPNLIAAVTAEGRFASPPTTVVQYAQPKAAKTKRQKDGNAEDE